MKANQDKFHYLPRLEFSLPACILDNSGSQKLLDVTIDRKLDFNEHVTNLRDQEAEQFWHTQEFCHIYPKHKNNF